MRVALATLACDDLVAIRSKVFSVTADCANKQTTVSECTALHLHLCGSPTWPVSPRRSVNDWPGPWPSFYFQGPRDEITQNVGMPQKLSSRMLLARNMFVDNSVAVCQGDEEVHTALIVRYHFSAPSNEVFDGRLFARDALQTRAPPRLRLDGSPSSNRPNNKQITITITITIVLLLLTTTTTTTTTTATTTATATTTTTTTTTTTATATATATTTTTTSTTATAAATATAATTTSTTTTTTTAVINNHCYSAFGRRSWARPRWPR